MLKDKSDFFVSFVVLCYGRRKRWTQAELAEKLFVEGRK